MSTRATYKIGKTTFYCHYDGYPAGAACRFANMIAALTVAGDRSFDAIDDRRGGLEFAFIRGNMDAEPTEGHDAHGDTDYRYTVQKSADGHIQISVHKRSRDDQWVPNGGGDLADWLNGQRAAYAAMCKRAAAVTPKSLQSDVAPEIEALEAIPVIVRMAHKHEYSETESFTYANLEQARKIREREETIAANCKTCVDGSPNPNHPIHARRAQSWATAIAEAEFEAA